MSGSPRSNTNIKARLENIKRSLRRSPGTHEALSSAQKKKVKEEMRKAGDALRDSLPFEKKIKARLDNIKTLLKLSPGGYSKLSPSQKKKMNAHTKRAADLLRDVRLRTARVGGDDPWSASREHQESVMLEGNAEIRTFNTMTRALEYVIYTKGNRRHPPVSRFLTFTNDTCEFRRGPHKDDKGKRIIKVLINGKKETQYTFDKRNVKVEEAQRVILGRLNNKGFQKPHFTSRPGRSIK